MQCVSSLSQHTNENIRVSFAFFFPSFEVRVNEECIYGYTPRALAADVVVGFRGVGVSAFHSPKLTSRQKKAKKKGNKWY
jgi:hypothetical protein